MTEELDRELARRQRDGEPLFEYFAPVFVETRKVNGRLVKTRRPLLYNYLFVRASEAEIYRIKQRLPQYNFLPRVRDGKEAYHYPYLTDRAMRDLRWIARSYAEPVPVCGADPVWLVKGDRIRITEGRFAGIEARVVTTAPSRHKEIIVTIDNWMCVPLLSVEPGQYEVIELNAENPCCYSRLNNSALFERLHTALCHHLSGEVTDEDRGVAAEVVRQYGSLQLESDVMRSKLYACCCRPTRSSARSRSANSCSGPFRRCSRRCGPNSRGHCYSSRSTAARTTVCTTARPMRWSIPGGRNPVRKRARPC